ncbi:hypothetical protein, partial [Burkholderia pseudomallei]|uniref:hypothetical protein n=1 Tax=Burkholderia pseudomallei TaxID=28450 RepID=UPI001E28DD9F
RSGFNLARFAGIAFAARGAFVALRCAPSAFLLPLRPFAVFRLRSPPAAAVHRLSSRFVAPGTLAHPAYRLRAQRNSETSAG